MGLLTTRGVMATQARTWSINRNGPRSVLWGPGGCVGRESGAWPGFLLLEAYVGWPPSQHQPGFTCWLGLGHQVTDRGPLRTTFSGPHGRLGLHTSPHPHWVALPGPPDWAVSSWWSPFPGAQEKPTSPTMRDWGLGGRWVGCRHSPMCLPSHKGGQTGHTWSQCGETAGHSEAQGQWGP